MSVSIRQLTESDWRKMSEIRLKALRSDPSVFGSNYAVEAGRTETDWRKWFDDPVNKAIFMVYDGERAVGMTCISVDRDDPTKRTAILMASWLEPGLRGKGISGMMYEARINWAKAHPTVERIIVSHRASNLASKYASQKHGFTQTHVTERTWPDGTRDEEFHYELLILRTVEVVTFLDDDDGKPS